MAAPTFVAEYETVVNTTTSPKTVSVTTAVGDVLVLFGVAENRLVTLGTPSGGTSLTWTSRQEVTATPTADWCTARVWTATATTAETFTLSVTRTGDTGQFWGWICLRWSGSDGIGASAKTNVSSGAPSLAITTTGANSAVCCANTDWNALATSRTWRTVNSSTGTEQMYVNVSGRYTSYANRWNDVGAAGSKTVGLSAPTGQKYSIVAVEVLGSSSTVTGTLSEPVPILTADLNGTVSLTGTLSEPTPRATADLNGTVTISGTLNTSTPDLTGDATGAVRVTGALSEPVPLVEATATGTVRVAGSVSSTTPDVTADLAGTVQVTGTTDATVPLSTATITGSVAGVVTGTLTTTTPTTTASATGTVTVTGTLSEPTPRVATTMAGTITVTGTGALVLPIVTATLGGTLTTFEDGLDRNLPYTLTIHAPNLTVETGLPSLDVVIDSLAAVTTEFIVTMTTPVLDVEVSAPAGRTLEVNAPARTLELEP